MQHHGTPPANVFSLRQTSFRSSKLRKTTRYKYLFLSKLISNKQPNNNSTPKKTGSLTQKQKSKKKSPTALKHTQTKKKILPRPSHVPLHGLALHLLRRQTQLFARAAFWQLQTTAVAAQEIHVDSVHRRREGMGVVGMWFFGLFCCCCCLGFLVFLVFVVLFFCFFG